MKNKLVKRLGAILLSASLAFGGLGVAPATEVQAAASQFTGIHFDDGFDYYDTGKWHKAVDYSNGDMFWCTWRDANVAFNNGVMEMSIKSDDWQTEYTKYSGGEYRTNQAFHYGMYQVNMKPIKNDGVVTSFFTYTGPSDGTNWDEIDIEFLGKDTTKVQFNYYSNGVGGHEYVYNLGFDASQEYHTYGFYWADDYIAWYVDGNEVYRTPASDANIIPDEPSRIMMNVWPGKGVDDWLNPYNGVTPLTGYYDWMSWDAPGTGDSGSTDTNTGTSTDTNTSTDSGTTSTVHLGDGFESYDTNVWHKAVDYSNGDMFWCTWRDANVAFNNGIMELKIDSDNWQTEYTKYSGGEYRTNGTYHYGMYQVNMKPIKNPGVVTSFFTYTGPSDGTNWDEIDIEFLGKDTTKVQFNYYTNGVGGHEYVHNLGFDASEGFHTYGFYWADDYIAWYVDGVEVYRTPADQASIIPDEPSRIMMNAWPGINVDDWLQPYNGVTPLIGYYDWMAYDGPNSTGGDTTNSGSTDSGSTSSGSTSTGSTSSDSASTDVTEGQAEFDSTKIYKITSKVSGKALDVDHGYTDDGTNVLQYTYEGRANQQWYIKKQSNGYHTIENVATGKVLSVQDQSTENGANVHQWTYVGNANQQWSIWKMEDGTYKIINRQSGKCLDLTDSSTADNANIQQWEETAGSQAIYWNIDLVDGQTDNNQPEFAEIAIGTKVEAETGTLSNGAVVSNKTSCSGGKRVGNVGGPSKGAASFSVNVAQAGEYEISTVYCTLTERTLNVEVNGEANEINCPGTGGWDTPSSTPAKVVVNLNAGWNTISFTGSGTAYAPNVDWFEVNKVESVSTYLLAANTAVATYAVEEEDVEVEEEEEEDSFSEDDEEYTTLEEVSEFITANEEDVEDSSYNTLGLRVTKSAKTSQKLKWNKVKEADGYVVFANKSGEALEKVKTIKNGKTTSFTNKKLKKATYYTYIVVAYKNVDGEEVVVSTSEPIYVPTKGGKYGDVKSIKVNKSNVSLKEGKTVTIKASEVKDSKSKKISSYKKINFESTDTTIATVNNKGKIKAVSKGTCYVYAYAQNGVSKKIKVTVK